MAIQWGNGVGNFRLGLDLIDNGSSFTWILYGQSMAYGHNWSYTVTFGGSASGTVTGSFYSGYGQTVTKELHRWSTGKVTYTATARLVSALVNGAYVSRGITVTPKPAAPSNISVSRNSDSSHTVSWTRNSTATSVRLERRTNGGAWQHVSSVSSNAASITDTTTKAGNRYQWRVRVANAGGTSDWSNLSSVVYTTPPVPTGVTATRVGNNIRVNGSVHANASHVDIQDDGTTVVSALAKASLPWTHSSPSQVVTHRYRMRARVASGTSNSTTLYSGWSSYSSTVQLTAPPAAPTNLAPNGAVIEQGSSRVLSWRHNPTDSSEQSAYELRYRVDGGAWTTLSGTTDSSRTVSFDAGVVEWQVRTKGAHPDWSPWSAAAQFDVISKPTVAIQTPSAGDFHEAELTVTWSFFQAQGRPQSAWRARLLRDGQVLETKQGTGSASSTTFSHRLEDGYSYTVGVDAASGSIWSAVESVSVDASFILPAPAVLEGVWNDATGAVDLQVSVLDQPSHPDVVNLAPRIEGDGTWAEVARFPTGSEPPEMDHPEDFRLRDLGTGESVMEIERVAGFAVFNSVAGVSTKAGKPAVRIIPTGFGVTSMAYASVPVTAPSVTAVGTMSLDAPLQGTLGYPALSLGAGEVSASAPNLAGDHPLRVMGGESVGGYATITLINGATLGNGDVWWTDIGLFAGDYQGDYFDGDTGWVLIDGVWMHTRWNPDGTSTASMPDTAVSMTVERSVDDGNTWAPVLVDESGVVQVADHEALSNGVTIYRVTTYAATGAATVREYPVGADSEAVWIGGGVGHAVTARLPYSPQITINGGRERTMFRFSGRPKPVVYAGEGISRVVDSNGMILVNDAENTQPDDLILVAQNEEPTHLYRDPDGRHVTGMLTDIQVARQSHAHWAYSFQLEESED